jgi:SAM-dependent methyltransferase
MFGTFFEPVEKDSFLTELSARPGHAFLGNAIQGVCIRQVRFIAERFRQRTAERRPRILDWGCGLGQNSYLLQCAGFDVVSADVAFACGEVSEKCGIPYVGLTDKTKLPFADGEFDAVTSFGVLEHVPDDLGSMREIHRVLNSTGTFFVFFLPYIFSWGQRLAHLRGNYYHDRLYSKTKLRDLADSAGFNVESLWHGQLFPKNTIRLPQPAQNAIEVVDRFLTTYTPLRYFATNLEAVLPKASPARPPVF